MAAWDAVDGTQFIAAPIVDPSRTGAAYVAVASATTGSFVVVVTPYEAVAGPEAGRGAVETGPRKF